MAPTPRRRARVALSVSALTALALTAALFTLDTAPAPTVAPAAAPSATGVEAVPARADTTGAAAPWASPRSQPFEAALTAAGTQRPAYVEDALLVGVREAADIAEVAADLGLRIVEPVGPSGFGALGVPDGEDRLALRSRLLTDPRVRTAGAMGLVYGAGSEPKRVKDHQWHRKLVKSEEAICPEALGDVVVAVLDTGVAYTDAGASVGAPSLADSAIVAPWDFVEDDAEPLDDHQHGTHIASLIGSMGEVEGIAPGVGLMPIKVLDDTMRGTELDLLNGLAHAVDNGADVINLSLSFTPGYQPSGALRTALSDARKAGVVVVAATGNDGLDKVTWPAASPSVIAVAASDSRNKDLAWYSNASARVDLLAPGGSLELDEDSDDRPDGMLAETIAYNDPSHVGYYYAEGTSQATAIVSGAAARLLAAGVEPDDVGRALGLFAKGIGDVGDGYGAGVLDLHKALDKAPDEKKLAEEHLDQVHVVLLPWLERHGDDEVEPHARLLALDNDGTPVKDVELWVTFDGTARALDHCKSKEDGCEVKGPRVAREGAAFTITVEGASDKDGIPMAAPTGAFFASDALEVLLAAVEDHPEAAAAMPAFLMAEGKDDELGDVAAHYIAVNTGSGFLSSPMGIVFTPDALGREASLSTVSLSLDGTGLMSSPMGFHTANLLTFDGRRALSAPPSFRLVTLGGSGLMSSPMGLMPQSVYGLSPAPVPDMRRRRFSGNAVLLGSSTITGASATDTSVGRTLERGGWVALDGTPGASSLAALGFATWPEAPVAGSALHTCAVPFEE